MTATPRPWARLIGFGLGVLRLSPDAFWRMTPRELAYAIDAATGGTEQMDRTALSDLMNRFPDRAGETAPTTIED
jgi:uncharacterized phage protein (TIGR02216 family)